VIVGPRADELQPDPQGSGIFFGTTPLVGTPMACGWPRARRLRLVPVRQPGLLPRVLARPEKPIYPMDAFHPRHSRPAADIEERPMAWTTPTLVEICIGLEINGYLPAEF
jgi:coenzyme PQQ precursor peptide PqqA